MAGSELERHVVSHIMMELKEHAKALGFQDAWNKVVVPWASFAQPPDLNNDNLGSKIHLTCQIPSRICTRGNA